jgi:hypothetical protein
MIAGFRWTLTAALLVALSAFAQDSQKTPPSAAAPPTVAAPAPGPKAAPPVTNVLSNSAVGDWLEYAVRTDAAPQAAEMKARQTVTAKDAQWVTLKTTGDLGTHEIKISLQKPYEPYMPVGETDATSTKLKEGKETLTIRGKTYTCKWVQVKVLATKPTPTDCVTKVWTCKDVPVTGVVKLESLSSATAKGKTVTTKLTMELVASGKQG